MAISDLYVVERILQETMAAQAGLVWCESEGEGYSATLNSVELQVLRVHSITGSRIFVVLSREGDRVYIGEPARRGILRPSYESSDHLALARAMNELLREIVRQCVRRREEAEASADHIKETLYRRLLFGLPEESDAGSLDPTTT